MSDATERDTMQGIPRRKVLRDGGATAAAILAGVAGGRALAPGAPAVSRATKRLGMVIDLRKCVGCKACAVACKAENGVRLGGFRSWVSERETGAYPSVRRIFVPRLCNQCGSPPCMDVCPTGATYRRDDGIVSIDKEKCIGCRHCMGACPYNSRFFNAGPDAEGEVAFPSSRHGTVDKCDFCLHRVDNGVTPACVNTCPAGARTFGDLSDPGSAVSRRLAAEESRGLLLRFGTSPNVIYLGLEGDEA